MKPLISKKKKKVRVEKGYALYRDVFDVGILIDMDLDDGATYLCIYRTKKDAIKARRFSDDKIKRVLITILEE